MAPRSIARPLAVGAIVSLGSTAAGAAVAAIAAVDSPVAAVAGWVIDTVPSSVAKWAIRTFGTNDKLVLGIGIVAILTICAAGVALAAVKRRWLVPLAIVVFSIVGYLAADDAGPGVAMSCLATALAAYVAFVVLVPTLRTADVPAADPEPTGPEPAVPEPTVAEPMVIHRWDASVDRRSFVARAGVLGVGTAALAGIAASINRSDSTSRVAAEAKFPTVPTTGPDAAPVVTPGATVGASGIEPFITPNDDFYRIDTAFLAPRIDLADWTLTIAGAVDRELTLTYDQLLSRHVVERIVTLCCVSNEVGGDLIGTAKFIGIPLAELLDEVGVRPEGTQIAMTSDDGWTCGFPTDIAMDGRDALVAIGMNGEPLPVEHGFPARIVVPGLYGYVSATKWVTKIELVGWDDFDGYWIPRGWSKKGPVKTQSRIDVPRRGADLTAGTVAVAGVAWAQHLGIDKVEVKIDDGTWQEAELGDEVTIDAWRQWVYQWDATSGSHEISVRATDRGNRIQPSDRLPPAPDGATGHHTIKVDVA